MTGAIPAELGNLINLQGLYLWNEFGFRSELTGSIPAELGRLTNLVGLSLSGHQLTGSIPAELGRLINLHDLWLSGNQLTGSIPAELGRLVNLRWLALYENDLSGPLPSSLTNLRELEWLLIQDNAGLCAPADAAVQAWLATIDDFEGDTCAAPQPVGTLAPLTVGVHESAVTVEVSGAFVDANGDTLTYGAMSSAPGVASVVVIGSAVVVTPVSEGSATVTVTATDAGGSNETATQMFSVTVIPPANRPPEAVGVLPPVTLAVDELAVTVDVASVFRDPDGDALTYRASSSAPRVVTARAAGAQVTLAAVDAGTATVEVTATDAGGLSAVQSFRVRVTAPFTDDPIVPGETPVRAVHFTELRARIDVLRQEAGLAPFGWTDPVLRGRGDAGPAGPSARAAVGAGQGVRGGGPAGAALDRRVARGGVDADTGGAPDGASGRGAGPGVKKPSPASPAPSAASGSRGPPPRRRPRTRGPIDAPGRGRPPAPVRRRRRTAAR